MKRKAKISIGVVVVLATLFINLFFPIESKKSDFTFDNTEALAGNESGPTPTCIHVGTICTGVDKDGNVGVFSGLKGE